MQYALSCREHTYKFSNDVGFWPFFFPQLFVVVLILLMLRGSDVGVLLDAHRACVPLKLHLLTVFKILICGGVYALPHI